MATFPISSNMVRCVRVLATVLFVFFLTSCKGGKTEDSPTSEPVDYTLSIEENRQGYVVLWTVDGSGRLDSVGESIDDLYVTKMNKVTIHAESTDAKFAGVAVESGSGKIVEVSRIDGNTFRLKYKSDGETDITVWTGKKGDRTTRRIHVKAKTSIYPQGLRIGCRKWIVDSDAGTVTKGDLDTTFLAKLWNDRQMQGGTSVILGPSERYENEEGYLVYPFRTWYELTIIGLEPENASYRYMKSSMTSFKAGYDRSASGEYFAAKNLLGKDDWIEDVNDNYNRDISVLFGKKVYLYSSENGLIVHPEIYDVDKSDINANSSTMGLLASIERNKDATEFKVW